MEEKIKVGDVVEIKSQGPHMTVDRKTNDGMICVWFVCGNVYRDTFSKECLKIVKESDVPF